MHKSPLTHIGDLTVKDFLSQIWQQTPLYVSQCLNSQLPNIDSDDIAGLALEDDVESRLIQCHQKDTERSWTLEHGPFSEHQLTHLPPSNWTLLIQAADIWIADISQFLDLFRFLPNWRLDDIMISCAADGGGVGPHFDFYDVFLIQVRGNRTWHIGPMCNDQSERVKDSPVNQIPDFEPESSYHTKPGDLLYIPAGKAHWGIAQGDDCMTISVGFRAPSDSEILSSYTDFLSEKLFNSERYRDDAPTPATNPGEISDHVINTLRAKMASLIDQPEALISWFGQQMTEVKYPEIQPQEFYDLANIDQQQLEPFLAENTLETFSASRLAYKSDNLYTKLFVGGEEFITSLIVAETLCRKRYFEAGELSHLIAGDSKNSNTNLLVTLVNQGVLLVAQD